MTDETCCGACGYPVHATKEMACDWCRQAADRIEDLIAERDWYMEEWVSAVDRLNKAVEALEVLIQLAHDCEKELTEDLYHVDFCGESMPLTKARATLAEIKGESHD